MGRDGACDGCKCYVNDFAVVEQENGPESDVLE